MHDDEARWNPSQPAGPRAAAPTLVYVRPGVLPRRPGVLTALAVGSLIVASVGFVVNVYALAFHAGVWWLEPPAPTFVPPAPIPSVHVEPYDGDPAGVDGLRRPTREAVVEHVRARLKLPPDRAEMLARLLADVGARVFPRDATLDPFDAKLLHETGRMENGPDGAGPRGSHFFVTPRGRVELSDFFASFAPDAGGNRVRVLYNGLSYDEKLPRWSALAIEEALNELHATSGGVMSAQQATVLLRELRGRTGAGGLSWDARPSVPRAIFWQRGSLSYNRATQRGDWIEFRPTWLLPDGRMADFAAAPHGIDPITGVPYVRVAPPAFRYWPGQRGAIGLLAVNSLAGAVLAAYLFVGAILLLREMPGGAERHARFLLWKLPVLLAGTFALLWWRASVRDYAALPSAADELRRQAPLLIAVTFVYPLGAAVALRARSARRYFASRGQDPWHDLRRWMTAILEAERTLRGRLLVRGALLVTVALALLHLGAGVACFARDVPLDRTGLLHLLGAQACALVAVGLLFRRRVTR